METILAKSLMEISAVQGLTVADAMTGLLMAKNQLGTWNKHFIHNCLVKVYKSRVKVSIPTNTTTGFWWFRRGLRRIPSWKEESVQANTPQEK